MAKRIVYYDVSRLVNRSDAHHATGIDRVDLRYSKYLLEHNSTEFYALMQVSGFYFVIPQNVTSKFIHALYEKWMGNGAHSFCLRSFKQKQISYGKSQVNNSTLDSIHPELLSILKQNSDRDSLYFNCSHHGITDNIKAIQTFKVLGQVLFCYYLHDLIPIDFPEFVRVNDDKIHFDRVKTMLTYGDMIFVNSTYTMKRLESFCKEHRFSTPPISITRIGIENNFLKQSIETPHHLSKEVLKNYFVYVSTIEPRKNHLLLLNIWRQLVSTKQEPPYLILVGQRGWNNQIVFDMIDRTPSLRNHVLEFNNISDDELVRIVKHAKASLFPSFSEGWGMPLVESAALKTPVICSDIIVFHEAGQGKMIYINNIDGTGWMSAILKMCHHKERLKHTSILHDFDIPTWEQHFNIVERSIGSAILNKSGNTLSSECNYNDFKKYLTISKVEEPFSKRFESFADSTMKSIEHKVPYTKFVFDIIRKTYLFIKSFV